METDDGHKNVNAMGNGMFLVDLDFCMQIELTGRFSAPTLNLSLTRVCTSGIL